MLRLSRVLVPFWAAVLIVAGAPRVGSHNPITTTVLFNREVATLLNNKCSQCHREGAAAMPLQTYAETRPWAIAIKEEILARRMPPWPAERGYGAFANDNSLTTREQDFLISWIDGGVPEGTQPPPALLDHSAHWMLGEPDAIYSGERPSVPAGGPVGAATMTQLSIRTGLRRDTWVRALDFKPGDARSVRAAFFRVSGTGQYLGGWTPWHSTTQLPDGAAFKLPANAVITVNLLYGSPAEPAAAPSTDPARLAVYFAQAPARQVSSIVLAGGGQGVTGRLVGAEHLLARDSMLLDVRVEMSTGGRSLELKARRPDGSFEPMLWIKDFPQDWQTPFVFRSPVPLPRGAVLLARAHFEEAPDAPRFQVTLNTFEGSPPRTPTPAQQRAARAAGTSAP